MKKYYVITFDSTGDQDHSEYIIELILKNRGQDLTYVTKTTIKFWTSKFIYSIFKGEVSSISDLNYFLCRIGVNNDNVQIDDHKNTNISEVKSFKEKVNKVKTSLSSQLINPCTPIVNEKIDMYSKYVLTVYSPPSHWTPLIS